MSATAYALGVVGNRSFLADLEVDPSEDMGAIVRGEVDRRDLRAHWLRGARTPTRVVATSHLFPLLVHEAVAESLARNGIEGWDLVPVSLVGANGQRHLAYSLLVVRGRCGPLGIASDGTPLLDAALWRGEEICSPEGSTTLLLGPRAFAVFDALRERHLRFTAVRVATETAAA